MKSMLYDDFLDCFDLIMVCNLLPEKEVKIKLAPELKLKTVTTMQ
jgi:hypothetical protein